MDLEKFRRHVGKPVKLELKNDDGTIDEFEFKPLGVEQFTEFMLISEKMAQNPDAAMMKELVELYKGIIRSSYPDVNDEMAEAFLIKNFVAMTDIMEKLCPVSATEDQKKMLKDKIAMMRKAYETPGKDTSKAGKEQA